jgi:hypothetical protein
MLLGDRVRIELSPYDLDRGRIVYHLPVARREISGRRQAGRSCTPLSASVTSLRMSDESTAQTATQSLSSW